MLLHHRNIGSLFKKLHVSDLGVCLKKALYCIRHVLLPCTFPLMHGMSFNECDEHDDVDGMLSNLIP